MSDFIKRAIEAALALRVEQKTPGVEWSQTQSDWEGTCRHCQHRLKGSQVQLAAPWKHGLCQGGDKCRPK